MYSLFISFAVLIVGCFVYGKVVEKVFAPDGRQTPAIAVNDGVDCVPMKTWKAFLVINGFSHCFYDRRQHYVYSDGAGRIPAAADTFISDRDYCCGGTVCGLSRCVDI